MGTLLSTVWTTWYPSISDWPQAVIPIPLHRAREKERGYNQAQVILQHWDRAYSSRVPILPLLTRIKATLPQTEQMDKASRRNNLEGAFALCEEEVLSGCQLEHVALFDDVVTTGATMQAAASILLSMGIARIDVWSVARA